MNRVLVEQGVVFYFNEKLRYLSGPVTVLRIWDWSKVLIEGIRRLE